MLDDTEDSVPSLLNISLDDVEHVCHSCGVCNKNTRKFIKRDLEAFMSTMHRNIIEIAHHNSSTHKSEPRWFETKGQHHETKTAM
jgi:hypothetical protein